MSAHRRQRGFSMIELAVALVVLALLVMAALPTMSDWMRNLRIRNAAESMQYGLQKARAEALRRNQNITFWLVSGDSQKVVDNSCALAATAGSWVISGSDPAGACAAAPSTDTAPMIVETHAAGDGGDGVTVNAVAADATAATCVRFNGFGQVVPSTVPPDDGCRMPKQISTIDLTHVAGGRQLRIVVSSGGGVRMCDRGVTDATDPRKCP